MVFKLPQLPAWWSFANSTSATLKSKDDVNDYDDDDIIIIIMKYALDG